MRVRARVRDPTPKECERRAIINIKIMSGKRCLPSPRLSPIHTSQKIAVALEGNKDKLNGAGYDIVGGGEGSGVHTTDSFHTTDSYESTQFDWFHLKVCAPISLQSKTI